MIKFIDNSQKEEDFLYFFFHSSSNKDLCKAYVFNDQCPVQGPKWENVRTPSRELSSTTWPSLDWWETGVTFDPSWICRCSTATLCPLIDINSFAFIRGKTKTTSYLHDEIRSVIGLNCDVENRLDFLALWWMMNRFFMKYGECDW